MQPQPNYGKRLHKAAREDFKGFWSAHRFWVTFVSLVATCIPLLIQVARHGVGSMVNLQETLTSAIAGLLVSLGGNYLISVGRAAKALDAGLLDGIQQRDSALEQVARDPAEEHHYQIAAGSLQNLSDPGKAVLRYLWTHGRIIKREYSRPKFGIPGMDSTELAALLNGELANIPIVSKIDDHDFTSDFTCWEIPLGFRNVLARLLFTDMP